MSNYTHRIRRFHCLVSTSSQTEAFAIRKSLHDRWQDTIIPAFESAFDSIAKNDRTIHIPKLELYLKVTSEQELLKILPALIQQQLSEQLQSIDLAAIPTTHSEIVWQEVTAKQERFTTLLYYLQTGLMPWQASHASTSEIAVELQETCQQERSQLVHYLFDRSPTAAFYFRLLQLLPVTKTFAFVNTLFDGISGTWKTEIVEFVRFILDPAQSRLDRHTQWQIVAAIISECLRQERQNQQPDFSRILDRVLSQLGIDRAAFISLMPAAAAVLFQPPPNSDGPSNLTTNPPTTENPKTAVDGKKSARSPLNPDSIETTNESGRSSLNSDVLSLFNNGGQAADRENELSNYTRRNEAEITAIDDVFPLAVSYAGLVLLHPFISPFFEATGVKETNSKILADNRMPRAAALLHFLATGRTELYEWELGLIKILLGLKPETPLLVGEGLVSENDRAEAETVLHSTINYWSVLKNTSIEGLRSSFLQRSGLLRQTETGWNLQVEHQSFDLLIEHLPWSINIIKLSWMKQPLYTEWQTF